MILEIRKYSCNDRQTYTDLDKCTTREKYEYVLAFSSGGRVEDVTQKYTQNFDAVKQRRKRNKSLMKKLFLM